VIAFLNNVPDASDTSLFHSYFTNFLRFQGTYIKDYGKHIDSHLVQLIKLGMTDPGVRLIKQFESTTISENQVVRYTWGAYVSVWKHDIAFGYRGGKFYIMEPNFGL
jgi:hypothetical protein